MKNESQFYLFLKRGSIYRSNITVNLKKKTDYLDS